MTGVNFPSFSRELRSVTLSGVENRRDLRCFLQGGWFEAFSWHCGVSCNG
jgi:hypothetical protein